MNRHARRTAVARNRKWHTRFLREYIRHLPRVPLDAPLERGQLYYTCFHHDSWCAFYASNQLSDCNCNLFIARHVEPGRS